MTDKEKSHMLRSGSHTAGLACRVAGQIAWENLMGQGGNVPIEREVLGAACEHLDVFCVYAPTVIQRGSQTHVCLEQC